MSNIHHIILNRWVNVNHLLNVRALQGPLRYVGGEFSNPDHYTNEDTGYKQRVMA